MVTASRMRAAREAWRELVGDMKPTVKTGGGGAHLYLRCPPDTLPPDQSVVMRQSARMVLPCRSIAAVVSFGDGASPRFALPMKFNSSGPKGTG
jgi:hypothetical protein